MGRIYSPLDMNSCLPVLKKERKGECESKRAREKERGEKDLVEVYK